MGATGIEWTRGPNGEPGFTFNPWIGCTKISCACDLCYAETASKKLEIDEQPLWGPHANRRGISDATWAAPLAWDRRAAREGRRFRVFSGSMCDILDNHKSIEPSWRGKLIDTAVLTPNLDWLFLSKRLENARRFLPSTWFTGHWPSNVWIGFTGEDQERFDHCARFARDMPAPVRFVSIEPMLGRIVLPADVREWLDWIICGGESGPLAKIRDTPLEHMDYLAVQAQLAGVPFFMKQMPQISWRARYKKFDEFPIEIRRREHPVARLAA